MQRPSINSERGPSDHAATAEEPEFSAWALPVFEVFWPLGIVLVGGGLALRGHWSIGDTILACGVVLLALPRFLSHRLNGMAGRAGGSRRRRNEADGSLERLKDAQWEMADRNLQYRKLLDAQQDFVVQRDASGHIVFANQKFCRAFDVRAEDIVGTMFCPPVKASELQRAAAGGGGRTVQLVRTVEDDLWISWDQHEVAGECGDVQVQSVGRDVSAERAAELALKEARDEAQAASRAKSRFLASMSHEIRTPLNGMLGMLTLIGQSELSGEQRIYSDAAENSARSLVKLVDDILDFSKIEAGKLELMSAPFSIRACASDAMLVLASDAAAKSLDFQSGIASDVPDMVLGDEMRVRQILLNLLSNAVKFTDRGSVKLDVRLRENPDEFADRTPIEIEVTDTGAGISPDMMRRLFQEFEQEDGLAASGKGGTGLGLAITRRLVRAMGGDVNACALPTGGTRFTARIVLDCPAPMGRAATVCEPQGSRSSRNLQNAAKATSADFSVLVAEDNAINALLAQKVIQKCGGTVKLVTDGGAAIAAVSSSIEGETRPYDLVLMDVQMPGVDGLQAARSIKSIFAEPRASNHRPPPIIALTANAFPEDRELCKAAGMDDYLAKPFDVRELEQMLQRWLDEGTGRPLAQSRPNCR